MYRFEVVVDQSVPVALKCTVYMFASDEFQIYHLFSILNPHVRVLVTKKPDAIIGIQ